MKNNILISIFFILTLQGCFQKYSYQENSMPTQVELTARLAKAFEKKKILCFGRYAVQVPYEGNLILGPVGFPVDIEIFSGNFEGIQKRVMQDINHLRTEDETSEITMSRPGPVDGSWQISYHEGIAEKELGLHFFNTYVNIGNVNFLLADAVEKGKTEEQVSMRLTRLASNLRLRGENEVPETPGFCVEHGFLEEKLYEGQETASAGLYLPSFPDVSFSISSSKDAYIDYPKEEFEGVVRAELSLLNRIKEAKDAQGIHYPSRTLLREGKRTVQHWQGEESLIRRSDGVHDFEWHFVGTPGDVANPSEFNVRMYTKVAHNAVGAAKAASLSDDEAVALWDTLLTGLKFRVKVPGAPKGSYFYPADEQTTLAAGQ